MRTAGDLYDCDDSDPEINVGLRWAEDQDRDGYSTGVMVRGSVPPPGYRSLDEIIGPGDCNDLDAAERPGRQWFFDADGDLHGEGPPVQSCTRPEGGFVPAELVTTTDCDGEDSEYWVLQRWYRDEDGDGYAAVGPDDVNPDSIVSCQPDANHTALESDLFTIELVDCDDGDAEEFPGQRWYPDLDGDGLGDSLSAPVITCAPPGATLGPVETVEIPITFRPTNAGVFDGQYLTVVSEAIEGGSLTKRLTGRGVAPDTAGPVVEVDVLAIDFGGVVSGEFAVNSLSVSNAGDQSLDATISVTNEDFSLATTEGGGAGELFQATLDVSLAAGASTDVDVRFQRSTPGESEGLLQIESDDPAQPYLAIELFGRAIRMGEPAIIASPQSLALPATTVGATTRASVVLENAGDAELEISSVALDAPGGGDLELVSEPGPHRLAPGGTLRVGVLFAPTAPGSRTPFAKPPPRVAASRESLATRSGRGGRTTPRLRKRRGALRSNPLYSPLRVLVVARATPLPGLSGFRLLGRRVDSRRCLERRSAMNALRGVAVESSAGRAWP